VKRIHLTNPRSVITAWGKPLAGEPLTGTPVNMLQHLLNVIAFVARSISLFHVGDM
jgi:hypothetical protein